MKHAHRRGLSPTGELRKIELPVKTRQQKHKEWNNTVLGHLRIEGAPSPPKSIQNRAQKFKALMEKVLLGKARFKTTVIESPQAMLAQMKKKKAQQGKQRKKNRTN